MNVNFNNLRRQAINAYNRLASRLNKAKVKDEIVIPAEELEKDMSDLRTLIGSVAMVHEEGNEDFKDVYSEMYPQAGNPGMVVFNDDEE